MMLQRMKTTAAAVVFFLIGFGLFVAGVIVWLAKAMSVEAALLLVAILFFLAGIVLLLAVRRPYATRVRATAGTAPIFAGMSIAEIDEMQRLCSRYPLVGLGLALVIGLTSGRRPPS